MSEIKSAWQIAMEKTQGLTVDKEEIKRKESFNKGRAFGLKSFEQPLDWVEQEQGIFLKDPNLDRKAFLQGFVEAMLAPFQLSSTSDSPPSAKAASVFKAVIKKDATRLFEQLGQVVNRYHDELENLRQAIIQQLGPRLQQRAEQLARQAGVHTQYVIERDPEFQKIFQQNAENIREQLQEYLDRFKAEVRRLI